MFNSAQFNQITFNGRRATLVSKVFQSAYTQLNFITEKTTSFATDQRGFLSRATSYAFEIMGLATAAAKIKAVVKDTKIRFRIK